MVTEITHLQILGDFGVANTNWNLILSLHSSLLSEHTKVLQLIQQRHGPSWTYYTNTHLGLWKCQSHHHNTSSICNLIFQTTGKMLCFPILNTSRSCTLVSDLPIMPTPIKVGSIQLCHILVCVCACVSCPVTFRSHHTETEKCKCSNIKSGKVKRSYTREFRNQIN
jgi:hypothetical protein